MGLDQVTRVCNVASVRHLLPPQLRSVGFQVGLMSRYGPVHIEVFTVIPFGKYGPLNPLSGKLGSVFLAENKNQWLE